jgi:catechol 2,3-dioxygenase-like lactoylglutathione lyase family enzyme
MQDNPGADNGVELTHLSVGGSDPLLPLAQRNVRRAQRCGAGLYVLLVLNAGLLVAVLAAQHGVAATAAAAAAAAAATTLGTTNLYCASECSTVCLGTRAGAPPGSGAKSCFGTCYDGCTARLSIARPSALGKYIALSAIQHVGITTSNLSRSVAWYTQVMGGVEVLGAGGPGWHGDRVEGLLMSQEAYWRGARFAVYAANVSATGAYALDARYVNFGALQIEFLDYSAADPGATPDPLFPMFPNTTAPSVATNMHISFDVRPEQNLNAFVEALENVSSNLGFGNVQCNRLVKTASFADAQKASAADPTINSFWVESGTFQGWRIAYCKGPDGEQLEFNQVIEAAAADFDQARAAYLTGGQNALWRR